MLGCAKLGAKKFGYHCRTATQPAAQFRSRGGGEMHLTGQKRINGEYMMTWLNLRWSYNECLGNPLDTVLGWGGQGGVEAS